LGLVVRPQVFVAVRLSCAGSHSGMAKHRQAPGYGGRMDWKLIGTVFGSVFVAELGDKTQLATMLFAARGEVSKWQVFLGSSCALLLSTALGVLAGQAISGVVDERTLRWIAGCSFLAIGLWTLLRG